MDKVYQTLLLVTNLVYEPINQSAPRPKIGHESFLEEEIKTPAIRKHGNTGILCNLVISVAYRRDGKARPIHRY
jgi:hypothetical protein